MYPISPRIMAATATIVAVSFSNIMADTLSDFTEAAEYVPLSVEATGSWFIDTTVSHDGIDSFAYTPSATSKGFLSVTDETFTVNGNYGSRLYHYYFKRGDGNWEERYMSYLSCFSFSLPIAPGGAENRIWIDELTSEKGFYATFTPASNIRGGTVSYSPDQPYFDTDQIQTVKVTATPDEGYFVLPSLISHKTEQATGFCDGPFTTDVYLISGYTTMLPFAWKVPQGVVTDQNINLFTCNPYAESGTSFEVVDSGALEGTRALCAKGMDCEQASASLYLFDDEPGVLSYYFKLVTAADPNPAWRVYYTCIFQAPTDGYLISASDLAIFGGKSIESGKPEDIYLDKILFWRGYSNVYSLSEPSYAYSPATRGTFSMKAADNSACEIKAGSRYTFRNGAEVQTSATANSGYVFGYWLKDSAPAVNNSDGTQFVMSWQKNFSFTAPLDGLSETSIHPFFYYAIDSDNVDESDLTLGTMGALNSLGNPVSPCLWTAESSYVKVGTTALCSDITSSVVSKDYSNLLAHIEGPVILSFWWAMPDSGSGGGGFLVNGQAVAGISPGTGWTRCSVNLPAGDNCVLWRPNPPLMSECPRLYVDGVDVSPSSGYTVNAVCNSLGSVSISPEKDVYDDGDTVTVTFTPNEDYQLIKVEGLTQTVTNNAITFAVHDNVNITATFANVLDDPDVSPSLSFYSESDHPWTVSTDQAFDGTKSYASGIAERYKTSLMEGSVDGPGVLHFRWRSSSSIGSNLYLVFNAMNGGELTYATQVYDEMMDWTDVTACLPAGQNSFFWSVYALPWAPVPAGSLYVDGVTWKETFLTGDCDQTNGGWLRTGKMWLYAAEAPWVYSYEHGWLYVVGSDTDSMYFYDMALGHWVWTARDCYPYFYLFDDEGRWIYYTCGREPNREYYDFFSSSFLNEAALR